MPIYLDDNGEPIQQGKVYLDDNGEPIQQATAAPIPSTAKIDTTHAEKAKRLWDAGDWRGAADEAMLAERENKVNLSQLAPTVGGAMGSFMGGIPGAAIGGAVGEAARQTGLRSMGVPGAPETASGQAASIGVSGLKQGALDMGGKLIGLSGKVLYKGGTALLPRTLKQEFPNLATSGFREGIALTRRGARKADRLVTASADEADALIAARQAQRPRVAGLLPEGQTPVPLGQTPTPMGGTGAVPRAAMTQPRKTGPVGNLEELMKRRWSPAYGGMAESGAPSASGDVVSGAGTIRRPMNAPAGTGKVPGMISFDEATAHVPGVSQNLQSRALGSNEPGLKQIDRYLELTRTGHQWPVPLTSAQALKRSEQKIAHNAFRAMDRGAVTQVSPRAQYAKAVEQGTREGIEREVPKVVPINARTQELLGLDRAATHASETGHILSRLGGVGAGALLGSTGGLAPALGAAAVGSMLTTPGGLTSAGLMAKKAGAVTPQMVRAALLALMSSHERE